MTAAFTHIDRLLRGQREPAQHPLRIRALLLVILCFGLLYGAVMGTFSATAINRLPQVAYAAVKVPILLVGAFLVSLPSFFVLNTLAGLRDDFAAVVRALLGAQGALTVILASLAPLTAVWYLSGANHDAAILFNGAMFAIASVAGQRVLRRAYAPLIARDPRHRMMLRAWLVIYAFVAIQMAWVLRPFVGSPDRPASFFREDAWGNAYVKVADIIFHVLH